MELNDSYYSTKVVVTKEETQDIEMDTREQSYSDVWKAERLKRITASKVGTIAEENQTCQYSKTNALHYFQRQRGNTLHD